MKKFLFVLVLFFIPGFFIGIYSQDKMLTIADVTSNYSLYPEYRQAHMEMAQLQWMKAEDGFAYIKGDSVYKGTIKGKKDDVLLNLITFNKAMVKKGLKELKAFPQITWFDPVAFRFVSEDKLLVFDISKKEVFVINNANAGAENTDLEPKSYAIAYTKDNNLFISKDPDAAIQVTNEKDKGIVNGQSVHRNEFGINKGTFWSSKGNYLAFYRMDQTMVTDYPIVNIDERIARDEPVKYPMAGMKSHEVTMGIYDVKSKVTRFLQTGWPKDQYLTDVCWSPDEQYIIIAVLNREQTHLMLNQYEIRTGEIVKTLLEEDNPKYVEPETPMIFFKTKPDRFLWFSKRDGYRQLYMYNMKGELLDQVTKGEFDVVEYLGMDEKEENVFYRAVDENFPLQKTLYSINIVSKEVVKLSAIEGVHDALVKDNGKFMFDMYSSPSVPKEINIIDANGMVIKNVYRCVNPLKDYKVGEVTVSTVKADDGNDLYYRMVKPVNFDPAKKYPVVVYVYGGPHSQMIENSWMWGTTLWMQYMAEQGFIVFTLDNHGTSNRGIKFEQAIFRNLGEVELKDQMKGIEYLKTLAFIDAEKIGVHGWSYGGFLTVSMMLKQPETFKVGVAGAPVIDWKYYEVMYGERYMDTPESNQEGYKNSNLLNYVKNLKGKLLLLQGTSDDTVVWQHSLKFVDECIKNGIPVDYFVFPGQKHSPKGAYRSYANTMIANYFIKNLK